jgi:hypothetical protein
MKMRNKGEWKKIVCLFFVKLVLHTTPFVGNHLKLFEILFTRCFSLKMAIIKCLKFSSCDETALFAVIIIIIIIIITTIIIGGGGAINLLSACHPLWVCLWMLFIPVSLFVCMDFFVEMLDEVVDEITGSDC